MSQDTEAASIVLQCHNLGKYYSEGPQKIQVLTDVNLQVHAGERIAVVGSSGSGKTTLLNLLGGLDLPSSGEVHISGKNVATLDEAARGEMRNRYLGFVYQFHHLLGEFTALENVCMPLLIANMDIPAARLRGKSILDRVGLSGRLEHKPSELSGGERARVAIARALIAEPKSVLMDEPTGNLDRHTAMDIQALMLELNRDLATSFVVVTHDETLAATLDRVLTLEDGRLQ